MGSVLGPTMAGIFVGFHEVDSFTKNKASQPTTTSAPGYIGRDKKSKVQTHVFSLKGFFDLIILTVFQR